ncbi:MAG: SH3 domain-containing protein [Legionella sp.]|nr:SH3 domain-containing protein [Legionella sp.]
MKFKKNVYRISMISVLFFLVSCADNQAVEKKLHQINQNPMSYIQPESLGITQQEQTELVADFLKNYFSPWDSARTLENSVKTLKDVQDNFKNFLENPGYSQKNQPIQKQFIETLQDNTDLVTYPNVNKFGIIVKGSLVRNLPTLLPSFGNSKIAGQGYPFDNLEVSYIEKGTPVQVLHATKDRVWNLIHTASYSGWVRSKQVGFVSQEFILQWKMHPFVITLRDHIPLLSKEKQVVASSRIGILYPMSADQKDHYDVLLPMADDMNGNAQIQTLLLDKKYTHPFPVNISSKNVAAIAQTMIGTPYGWGGLHQQRDCSATTSDLFAAFGIWLPRNSLMQAKRGKIISLAKMTSEQKLQTIRKQGIPFFTLIHAPGHITLYIGIFNQDAYILQDVWGVHTVNLFDKPGRAVIGKTVITPIDFGKGFFNVRETFLDKVDSMSILIPSQKQRSVNPNS